MQIEIIVYTVLYICIKIYNLVIININHHSSNLDHRDTTFKITQCSLARNILEYKSFTFHPPTYLYDKRNNKRHASIDEGEIFQEIPARIDRELKRARGRREGGVVDR